MLMVGQLQLAPLRGTTNFTQDREGSEDMQNAKLYEA
jgi:hypothetical protein